MLEMKNDDIKAAVIAQMEKIAATISDEFAKGPSNFIRNPSCRLLWREYCGFTNDVCQLPIFIRGLKRYLTSTLQLRPDEVAQLLTQDTELAIAKRLDFDGDAKVGAVPVAPCCFLRWWR